MVNTEPVTDGGSPGLPCWILHDLTLTLVTRRHAAVTRPSRGYPRQTSGGKLGPYWFSLCHGDARRQPMGITQSWHPWNQRFDVAPQLWTRAVWGDKVSPLEGHPSGRFIMFSPLERHVIMFSPLEGLLNVHFIMFSPLEGLLNVHFIMFSPLGGHPSGRFIMFSPLKLHWDL